MSAAQKIWYDAHPLRTGQTVPAGTELVEVVDTCGGTNTEVSSVSLFTTNIDLTMSSYGMRNLRTVEPLPDTDDTGEAYFIVRDSGDILMYNREYTSRYGATLTGQQARNFAHQILEALDG